MIRNQLKLTDAYHSSRDCLRKTSLVSLLSSRQIIHWIAELWKVIKDLTVSVDRITFLHYLVYLASLAVLQSCLVFQHCIAADKELLESVKHRTIRIISGPYEGSLKSENPLWSSSPHFLISSTDKSEASDTAYCSARTDLKNINF